MDVKLLAALIDIKFWRKGPWDDAEQCIEWLWAFSFLLCSSTLQTLIWPGSHTTIPIPKRVQEYSRAGIWDLIWAVFISLNLPCWVVSVKLLSNGYIISCTFPCSSIHYSSFYPHCFSSSFSGCMMNSWLRILFDRAELFWVHTSLVRIWGSFFSFSFLLFSFKSNWYPIGWTLTKREPSSTWVWTLVVGVWAARPPPNLRSRR